MNPLGKKGIQPKQYDPTLLYPIPRHEGRKALPYAMLDAMTGIDLWTLWECTWLNVHNQPQQAVIEMVVSAHSQYIVESKSLKLYLQSLSNHQVGNVSDFVALLSSDIAQVIGEAPHICVLGEKQLARKPLTWDRVDDDNLTETPYPQDHLLRFSDRLSQLSINEGERKNYYSHLFQSVCPVTAQPDYATVYLLNTRIRGADLLQYWLSFRHHQGFHEQCLEQCYCDLWSLDPDPELIVGGAFLRRGGIDIQPIRCQKDKALQDLKGIAIRHYRQ